MYKGWWIVVTHFVVMFFAVGFYQYSLPLLFPAVIEHFETDAATLNMLLTVHVAVGLLVGPLAGPVIAAAVVLPKDVHLEGLDDSKKVPKARRERLAEEIEAVAVGIGFGEVGPEEIDQRGIYQAALEAMRRSVASLNRVVEVDHLLVDARTVPGVDVPQTPIVKGDSKDASIAAASIVAKVRRDALMAVLGARYPAYGFERHMGYGTAEHMAALERFGPCPIHRHSFAPVEEAARRKR